MPFVRYFYRVDNENGYQRGAFLFQNIVKIKVLSEEVDKNYLSDFINLRKIDIPEMMFINFEMVKNLVLLLPQTLNNIIVSNDSVKEMFALACHICRKTIKITIQEQKKRKIPESSSSRNVKRIRTPSPIRESIDQQMEELLLFKSRLKYATLFPDDIIPTTIFDKFPQIKADYKAVIDLSLFEEDLNNVNETTAQTSIEKFKDLIVHSFVLTQQNNWIFVTQAEAYYHDKEIDDVAQISKNDEYPVKLTVNMEKCQEGRGSWYELRFRCQKIEIIATGGYYNNTKDNENPGAFLGVTAPAHVALDTNLIIISPISPIETVSCIRMLRNYRKSASLKKWCFKSSFFSSKNYTTPNQLRLFEEETEGYTSVCSKLLSLAIPNRLNESEVNNLEESLNNIDYWKDLDLDSNNDKNKIMERLEEIKQVKKAKDRKPSEAKRLLIELIISHRFQISNDSLMILYNGIIAPKVKYINNKRMKAMEKY